MKRRPAGVRIRASGDSREQRTHREVGKARGTMTGVRAVITGEHILRFEEFEVPEDPAGSHVLVKVERTIISAGTELANYTGLEPDTRTPGRWCYYPWVPGYGGIGRVLAIGPDVRGIHPGQRVYGILHHATLHM